MIKINLLPVGVSKKKEKILNQLLVGVLCILAVLGGVGYDYYKYKDDIQQTQDNIDKTKKEIDARKDVQKTLDELTQKKTTLDNQVKAINNLIGGRDFFIRVLDKITESVPSDQVWLSNINWGGPGGITIKGSAFDQDAVVVYMGNLSIIPCDDEKSDADSAEGCREKREAAGAAPEEIAKCDTEFKGAVCIEKDRECRRITEDGKMQPNYEGCRAYYKKMADESKDCKDKVDTAKRRSTNACNPPQGSSGGKNSPECLKETQQYKDAQTGCERAAAYNTKLHEEEYVRYSSVVLKSIRLTSGKTAAATEYAFELSVVPVAGGGGQ
jgi:type IV pilus assembly protein PilN